jgi:hypothetical protein
MEHNYAGTLLSALHMHSLRSCQRSGKFMAAFAQVGHCGTMTVGAFFVRGTQLQPPPSCASEWRAARPMFIAGRTSRCSIQ